MMCTFRISQRYRIGLSALIDVALQSSTADFYLYSFFQSVIIDFPNYIGKNICRCNAEERGTMILSLRLAAHTDNCSKNLI